MRFLRLLVSQLAQQRATQTGQVAPSRLGQLELQSKLTLQQLAGMHTIAQHQPVIARGPLARRVRREQPPGIQKLLRPRAGCRQVRKARLRWMLHQRAPRPLQPSLHSLRVARPGPIALTLHQLGSAVVSTTHLPASQASPRDSVDLLPRGPQRLVALLASACGL